MICKTKGCNNEVKKGWCLICQCEYLGYDTIGTIKDGEIVGLVLQLKEQDSAGEGK